MNNKFKERIASNIEEAITIYKMLCEDYEDVRLEQFIIVNSTIYFVRYRFPRLSIK